MAIKITMTVEQLFEMRRDLQLSIGFIKQGETNKAQAVLEDLLDQADDTIGRL